LCVVLMLRACSRSERRENTAQKLGPKTGADTRKSVDVNCSSIFALAVCFNNLVCLS